MLGDVDHVGYLARDLEGAIAHFAKTFGIQPARYIDRPQFSLVGCYLGEQQNVEIYSFTDGEILTQRLGGVRHLWTIPETSCGQMLQLIQH